MIQLAYARIQPLLPLAFWLAAAFALAMALLPHPPGMLAKVGDKYQHMFAFTVLATLAGLAWPRLALWRLALGLSLFGALIEVAQLTPGLNRTADRWDWLADTAAVLVALAIVAIARRILWLRAARRDSAAR